MTQINIRKIQNQPLLAGLGVSCFFPLQPQNYTIKCNSVTIWKKGEFERITRLHFLFSICNQVQKNCNQLRPSFSYKFIKDGYNSIQKQFVTVTLLKTSFLIQKIAWLQKHTFLVHISEQRDFIAPGVQTIN